MFGKSFLSPVEESKILDAIAIAEKDTSGEIRLHIEKKCKEAPLDRASFVFEKLEMHKTELRNGVLFYLAIESRQFVVLGDAGINAKVPPHFWEEVKDLVLAHFKKGEIYEGLEEGILLAGQKLKEHFPYQQSDKNELKNEISFGNES